MDPTFGLDTKMCLKELAGTQRCIVDLANLRKASLQHHCPKDHLENRQVQLKPIHQSNASPITSIFFLANQVLISEIA